VDVPLPVTSDPARIAKLHRAHPGPRVIFSTYQSLDKVHLAQKDHGMPELGLIVCDEAHRTIGYRLPGENVGGFH
jgi:predicted helicase